MLFRSSEVVDNSRIQPGDIIVGLASYGKATYENEYNAGMGSNGLTSARHDVFTSEYRDKYPETYDPAVPADLVYAGKHLVTDNIPGVEINVGKMVLSPTRTYTPVLIPLLKSLGKNIHGIVHCSGGAQTKILHFIEGLHIIKDNLFDVPPLFNMIHEITGTDFSEMYKVFNMGHRMEIYLPEAFKDSVIETAAKFGVDAKVIGRVEAAPQKRVTIRSAYGEFIYG